jgi:ATP-binding cassette subfamily F protein 3
VFVSHDRYFIDKLATRVFEVADGAVHVFPGNYEDYRWRKENAAAAAPSSPLSAQPKDAPAETTPSNGDQSKAKRLNPIKLKQMQERCAELEEEIEEHESRVRDLETALLSFVSVEETARLSRELKENRAGLDELLKEWEETSQLIAGQV